MEFGRTFRISGGIIGIAGIRCRLALYADIHLLSESVNVQTAGSDRAEIAAAGTWFGKPVKASAIDAHPLPKKCKKRFLRGSQHAGGDIHGCLLFYQLLLILKKMLNLFIALFLAFSCPSHSHSNSNGSGTVTTLETGGENGHIPPGTTPPPPPIVP